MGTNIAPLAIGYGVPVVLIDVSDAVLDQARQTIKGKLRHAQLMGALPPGRPQPELVTSVSLDDVADATTVIEAVTELPETKAKVLTGASAVVRPGTLLISNTSCIPVDEMAEWVTHPDELVGVHFMNPSYLIKMVEVIRGPRTGEPTMAALQGQNLAGTHAGEEGKMRDAALALFQCCDVGFHLFGNDSGFGCFRLLGCEERAGRVALGVAFGKGQLEDGPQIPAQMRHDAAGEDLRLASQERLQFLKSQ